MNPGHPDPRRHGPVRPDGETELPLHVERQLVDRARVDINAFSELYRHYLPRVHRFAWRRTGSVQAAEDVCAATFESALGRLDSFSWRAGGFAPWLFRIVTNEITDHYRREARPSSERGQRAMAAMHDPTVADPATQLPDDHDLLRRALDALNPRYQRAIALRYLADLDQDEAARAMGMTKPAFAVVLSRALKSMRKQLDQERPYGPAEGGDITDGR